MLRAIKGGKAAPPKPAAKPGPAKSAVKPIITAVADDMPVISLNLAPAKLSPAMAAYFKKCQDKLGFVPNVLLAYAFDMAKLETFVAMYNDLMLGESGLSKLEREMIAVAVSSQNRCYYCLTAHGAAVRQYSGNPVARRASCHELSRGAAEQAPACNARFCSQTDGLALERRGRRPRTAAPRRIYRSRHLGYFGRRRLLRHVEPRSIGNRYAAEHDLSRAGAVRPLQRDARACPTRHEFYRHRAMFRSRSDHFISAFTGPRGCGLGSGRAGFAPTRHCSRAVDSCPQWGRSCAGKPRRAHRY